MRNRLLPRLDELDEELLATSRRQRLIPLLMPYVWTSAFLALWDSPARWACIFCLIMLFSASSTSTHDVVHGSLGFSRRATEWALFLLGLPILESGHAYRATHLEHHRIFPSHEDLEGEAAHLPLWRVIASGPAFLPRLWWWAYRKASGRKDQRRWLLLEATLLPAALATSLATSGRTGAPLAFTVAVLVSSWFYPVFAVHLPHRKFGKEPETHAWT